MRNAGSGGKDQKNKQSNFCCFKRPGSRGRHKLILCHLLHDDPGNTHPYPG